MNTWFKNTNVKVLTGADFKNDPAWELKKDKCMFVGFFADWCGHCQNLKPEYAKFADIAQFITVAAIDSDDQKQLLDRMQGTGGAGSVPSSGKSPIKIKGFPTIWVYKQGKPLREYNGPRTAKGLLAEALNVCNEGCNC